MHDKVSVKGHIRIDKYDAQGNWYAVSEADNIFLTVGTNELWKLATGQSSNTFTNAQATIGIGDSSVAAAITQTDLQAATNKTYKAMNASYPTVPSAGSVQFQALFGGTDANYVWAEFVIRHAASLICIDRGVSAMGTKAAGTSWTATVTLSLA